MTKKHFKAFADLVKEVTSAGGDRRTIGLFARELCDVLATFNPRFDRNRFLAAAGIELGGAYLPAKS